MGTYTITSPIDGRQLGSVPRMRPKDVSNAFTALGRAQPAWADRPLTERLRAVKIIATVLRKERTMFAEGLVREIGKTPGEAESEVLRTADLVDETLREARRVCPLVIRDGRRTQVVFRVPLGIVAAISPFNYPLNLAVSKIAPALAAGNVVLWKPSSQGSLLARRFVSKLHAAGFPRDLLKLVTGSGAIVGDAIVSHPDCAMVAMTGSTKVGQRIAGRTGMIPLLLELGGNDPAIVLVDADLDLAAKHIAGGAFKLSGQRCTAIKRVYAVRSVADRLVRKIAEEMERSFATAGDPREHPVGPVIDDAQAKYLRGLITEAKRRGAELVRGGTVRGRFAEPTLLDQVPHAARVVGEEQFGPVLPVIRVKDAEEAVRLANDTDYGLQAAVFSKNRNRAGRLARCIQAGGIHLNGPDQRAPDTFLFTGHKASGIGAQGVRFALEAMTKPQAVIDNR